MLQNWNRKCGRLKGQISTCVLAKTIGCDSSLQFHLHLELAAFQHHPHFSEEKIDG